MSKTEELLKVLDLPKNEQWGYLRRYFDNVYELGLSSPVHREMYLADLAFRLRDEAVKHIRAGGTYERPVRFQRWKEAKEFIWEKHSDKCHPYENYRVWWDEKAKPIHWIIAALIVKKQESIK